MSSARMAESADATDLKSVIHWVYGFKSRSGYHLLFFRGERKVKQKKAVSLVFFKKESKIKKNIPYILLLALSAAYTHNS